MFRSNSPISSHRIVVGFLLGARGFEPPDLWTEPRYHGLSITLSSSNRVVRIPLGSETISGGRQNGITVDREKVAELYEEANALYAKLIRRLARGYEADPELRRDLLQEIHIELWRSLKVFDGRCSLQTWVYRVAHNVGASHIVRSRRTSARLVDLETLDSEPAGTDGETSANQSYSAGRLLDLIHQLKPLDRQLILLYLEGEAAGSIAKITGLSPSNISTKIHRIKKLLNQQYFEGAAHAPK